MAANLAVNPRSHDDGAVVFRAPSVYQFDGDFLDLFAEIYERGQGVIGKRA